MAATPVLEIRLVCFGCAVLCYVMVMTCFCLLSLKFGGLKASKISSIGQVGIVSLTGVCLMMPLVLLFYRKEFKQASVKLYPLRSLTGILGTVTWVEAVRHVGPNQAILALYLTIIIAALLASLLGKERLNLTCLIAGILCYAVIIFVYLTDVRVSYRGFALALLSPVCFAGYDVICKVQTAKEHFLIQVFYTFLFSSLFLSPIYLQYITEIQAAELKQLIGITILRVCNIIFLFMAIKLATINLLIPTAYLQFPLMATLGYLFFNKPTETRHWIAAAVLVGINVVMMLLNKEKIARGR